MGTTKIQTTSQIMAFSTIFDSDSLRLTADLSAMPSTLLAFDTKP